MFEITPQTRIIALDIETTGLSAARHRIVELAAVLWQAGREIGHFQTLIDPGCPIPASVIKIHGITDDMVRGYPRIHEVLPAFFQFCSADMLVAHNSGFDVGFIRTESQRNGIAFNLPPVHDTCSLARQRIPGCPSYRLEALKQALALGKGQSHRALDDARDCLDLFLACARPDAPVIQNRVIGDIPQEFSLLRVAIEDGGTVHIEYHDVRGRSTKREIRPIGVDGAVLSAHCLLRNDSRHFALERIKRIWRGEQG